MRTMMVKIFIRGSVRGLFRNSILKRELSADFEDSEGVLSSVRAVTRVKERPAFHLDAAFFLSSRSSGGAEGAGVLRRNDEA
jgi:hypothetical protein